MDEPANPHSFDQAGLAALAARMSGLLYHLRDSVARSLSLDGDERDQAFADARQQAYDVVYLEYIPEDALEIRGCADYELPDYSVRPRDELLDLVFAISWLALDLAQHLDFAVNCLKPEYRPEAYRQAVRLARDLADFPVADVRAVPSSPGIASFGERGLESWSR